MLLGKGQEWDWFGDPFYRVQSLWRRGCALPGWLDLPRIDYRRSADQFSHASERTSRSATIIIFCAYGVLYASSTQLPELVPIAATATLLPPGWFFR